MSEVILARGCCSIERKKERSEKKDLIGKVEENKVCPDAFHPFNLVQSSFHVGARAHKVLESIA